MAEEDYPDVVTAFQAELNPEEEIRPDLTDIQPGAVDDRNADGGNKVVKSGTSSGDGNAKMGGTDDTPMAYTETEDLQMQLWFTDIFADRGDPQDMPQLPEEYTRSDAFQRLRKLFEQVAKPPAGPSRIDTSVVDRMGDSTMARLLYSPMDLVERANETRVQIHIPKQVEGVSRQNAEIVDMVEAGGFGTAVFIPKIDSDDDEIREQEKKAYIRLMAVISQMEARAADPEVNKMLGLCLKRFDPELRREAWADLSKLAVEWATLILREFNSTIDAVQNNRYWGWLTYANREVSNLYQDYVEGYARDLRGTHDITRHKLRVLQFQPTWVSD